MRVTATLPLHRTINLPSRSAVPAALIRCSPKNIPHRRPHGESHPGTSREAHDHVGPMVGSEAQARSKLRPGGFNLDGLIQHRVI